MTPSDEEDVIKVPVPGTEPGEEDVVWGMIVSFERIGGGGKAGKAAYGVDVLVCTRENRDGKGPSSGETRLISMTSYTLTKETSLPSHEWFAYRSNNSTCSAALSVFAEGFVSERGERPVH